MINEIDDTKFVNRNHKFKSPINNNSNNKLSTNLMRVNHVRSNGNFLMMKPQEPQFDKLPECLSKERKTNKI
jgi:hypothetical protein